MSGIPVPGVIGNRNIPSRDRSRNFPGAPTIYYIPRNRVTIMMLTVISSRCLYTHVVFLCFDVHQWLGHVPSSLRHSRYVLVQQVLSGTGRGRRPTVVVVAARGRRHIVSAGRVAGLRGRAAAEVWRTAKRKHCRSDYGADRSDFWGRPRRKGAGRVDTNYYRAPVESTRTIAGTGVDE